MATCGPSNAFQNLKSHVQRDATLQREGVTGVDPLQRTFRPGRRDDAAAAQFDAFNSFDSRQSDFRNDFSAGGPQKFGPGFVQQPPVPRANPPDVGYMNFGPRPNLTHNVQGPPSAANAQQQHQSQDWASEFQKLSIQDNNAQHPSGLYSMPMANNIPSFASSSFGTPQFGTPQFANQSVYGSSGYPPSSNTDHSMNMAMEAAFAETEQSLKKLQQKENEQAEQEQHESMVQDRGNDASSIATHIINAVNQRADPELSNKVEGSKFMNLMNKLKNNEVKIDSKEFVDTSTNSAVDPDSLDTVETRNTANQDWPPQRSTPSSSSYIAREQPPEVRPERRRKYRFSRDLDDPDTYLRKLKSNLDPRLFHKSPYMSPFLKAQEMAAPLAVPAGSWEEKYEEW